jgi:adenylate cyclase
MARRRAIVPARQKSRIVRFAYRESAASAGICLVTVARTQQRSEAHPYQLPLRAHRAVLLVDVVESVRLIEQDEEGFVSRWLALVEQVKSDITSECGGRLVKSLGDGMLLEFDDVRSAVSAAFAIQHVSHRANLDIGSERHILLRMGLEISDVIIDESDVYGRGVNLAARLATLAGPGEIVASANVRDQLTADLDADIEDLGECYLKHLAEPVRAYRVGPPGPRPVIEAGLAHGELLPALAVVPFSARDPRDNYLVIGEVIAEELIRDLSCSPELNVISRLSTTVFRGRGATLAQISATLSANYVLSGEYRVDDRRIVIDAELAEAKSGQIVWTRRHKGQIAGILSGRRELIDQIASDVSAAVMQRELQRSQGQPLPTLKSYTLLIGAIALTHRLSTSDFEEARKLLEALIERAPRQALPRAWLANWHVLRVQQGWSTDPQQDARLALQSTKQALDADPRCSLALAVDGFVHTNLLKQLDKARERYNLALMNNPSDARAWSLKGTLHAFMGEGEQAVSCTRRALRLSPLDPHRWFYDSLAATAYLAAHRFDRALEAAKRSLRVNRTHTSTLRAQAVAQWQLGRSEEARATVQELLRLEPALTVSRWLARSPSADYSIGREWAEIFRKIGVPE